MGCILDDHTGSVRELLLCGYKIDCKHGRCKCHKVSVQFYVSAVDTALSDKAERIQHLILIIMLITSF